MRVPKGTGKAVKWRTYFIADSRYVIVGTNQYDNSGSRTTDYLAHYVSQSKTADHVTESIFASSHKRRNSYQTTPDAIKSYK
jgi:hypothetical protein